jgi:3-oxoacyl-[acyl-carrier protein] reductase
VIPDWIATERLSADERASSPPPVPLATVAGAVMQLIDDDSLAGRTILLTRGDPPLLI